RADVLCFLEADVLPGFAAVGGLIDSVAVRGIASDAGFAHAGVDDVGIGFGDGDGSDGAGAELAVGYRFPARACVGGLPDSAAGCAEVEDVALGRGSGDGEGTAAAEGS